MCECATHNGTIELVDERDRTVATLPLFRRGDPAKQIYRAIERWRRFGAVGGYARDPRGAMIVYV